MRGLLGGRVAEWLTVGCGVANSVLVTRKSVDPWLRGRFGRVGRFRSNPFNTGQGEKLDSIDPLIGALAAQLVNLVVMYLREFDGERRLDVRITWGTARPGERDRGPR